MSLNLGNDTRSGSQSAQNTQEDNKYAKYEPKQNKKIIRLLTVIAYVISVSMAAIILSLYYVFLWDPMTVYKDHHNQSEMTISSSSTSSPTLSNDNFITRPNQSLLETYSSKGDEADVVSDSISSVQDRSPSVEIYQEDPNSNSNSIQDTRYSMAGSYSQNYLINYDTLESGYRSSSSSSVIEKRSSNSQKLTNDETSKSKIIESSEDMSTNKRNPLKTESQQRKKHETDQLESIETKSASKPVMA